MNKIDIESYATAVRWNRVGKMETNSGSYALNSMSHTLLLLSLAPSSSRPWIA